MSVLYRILSAWDGQRGWFPFHEGSFAAISALRAALRAVALRNAPAGAVRAVQIPPCGAGYFLPGQKVTKEPLGGGANRIRLCLILHVPHPPGPHLREHQLGKRVRYRKGAGSSADWFPFYDRCR